ncbi:MAG TPA: hypothetical protein VG797_11835 [Phycisphaerales bacterium]|nr:hypothetical protein [Phycisphaerales bacterium]
MRFIRVLTIAMIATVAGCATVDITKTGKGTYPETVADDIDVLMTRPERRYEELGTVAVRGWSTNDTAKMHNAMRTKAAPLGANAVILTDTGVDYNGYYWANGVAVRWK